MACDHRKGSRDFTVVHTDENAIRMRPHEEVDPMVSDADLVNAYTPVLVL